MRRRGRGTPETSSEEIQDIGDGLVLCAEDVFFARAAVAHAEHVPLDDVAGRDELEPAIDVGTELAVGVVAQGSSQSRGEEVGAPHHRATGRDHHVLSRCRRAPALLLDERLAALVGHRALHGIELHGLVAGSGGIVQVVSDRAERAGHDHPAGLRLPRRLQHVAGAEDVALEHVAAMGAVACDGRDVGRAVIDAPTPRERPPGVIQIANVAVGALDLETFQPLIVVLVSQQHPDLYALVEQPAHEVGADMAGRTGHEHGRRRRARRYARSRSHRCRFPSSRARGRSRAAAGRITRAPAAARIRAPSRSHLPRISMPVPPTSGRSRYRRGRHDSRQDAIYAIRSYSVQDIMLIAPIRFHCRTHRCGSRLCSPPAWA